MTVVSIERFARGAGTEHANEVQTHSLERFMNDLHSNEESEASESDRGADGDSEVV